MNTRIYILICLGLLYLFPGVKAQIPNSPTTALTPNATAISRYGEIPVSLYTGTPEISIPIYTIQNRQLSLPISLSYHSGGVKPDEHPSWVGMGWSLRAGGVITRKKNDLIDEYNILEILDGGKGGYYYRHSITTDRNWEDEAYWKLVTDLYILDTEPDEFSFSFDGYSGTFVLDSEGKWQVCCERSVNLTMNGFTKVPYLGGKNPVFVQSQAFSGFTITTEEGVQYVFGGDDNAVEYSVDFGSQIKCSWEATAWYLKQIIHPNGDVIDFAYERGNYISQLSSSTNTVCYSLISGFIGRIENFGGSYSGIGYYGSLLSPVYLNTISTDDLRVNFNNVASQELTYPRKAYESLYSDANGNFHYLAENSMDGLDNSLKRLIWRQLNSIDIFDSESQLLKTMKFNYVNTPNQRLVLGQVTMSDMLRLPEEIYRFVYNDMNKLPGYLSNQTDHWGFYNNRPLGGTDQTYLDKEANPDVLTYGCLSEIVYPTGGRTLFYFEPHIYSKQLRFERFLPCEITGDCVAGGIRIKKMIDIPGNGQPPVTKEYLYVSDYSPDKTNMVSSGILGGQALYLKVVKEYATKGNDVDVYYHSASSSSFLPPCTNSLGYHVGYSQVVEKNADGGYVVNDFSNLDDPSCLDEIFLFSLDDIYAPTSSRANDRGKLRRQRSYNATGKLLKDISTIYEKDGNDTFVRAVRCQVEPIGNSHMLQIMVHGTVYKIFTYSMRKKEEVIMEYRENSSIPVHTKVIYHYNDKKMLDSKVVTTKKKGVLSSDITNYKYVWQFNPSFLSRHLLSPISRILNYRDSVMIEPIENEYTLLNGTIPVLSRVYRSKGDKLPELRYSCEMFDAKGNPVWVVNDGVYNTVYLWGYNYKYPIAEIKNATPGEVESVLGVNPTVVSDYQERIEQRFNLLRKKLPHAVVTTYAHIPSIGLSGVTDASGRHATYDYDNYGRLKCRRGADGNIIDVFQYQMDLTVKEMSPEERELEKRKQLQQWVSKLYIVGVPNLQPGETRTFGVDVTRFPCNYRWRLEGDTVNVSYTVTGNHVKIHNKKRDGTVKSSVSLYLDLMENGQIIASSGGYWFTLDSSELLMSITPEKEPSSDINESIALHIIVSGANNYSFIRSFLEVDGVFLDDKTPGECQMTDKVRFWVSLKNKRKGEYYQFVVTDNKKACVTAEIPVAELFPIGASVD